MFLKLLFIRYLTFKQIQRKKQNSSPPLVDFWICPWLEAARTVPMLTDSVNTKLHTFSG